MKKGCSMIAVALILCLGLQVLAAKETTVKKTTKGTGVSDAWVRNELDEQGQGIYVGLLQEMRALKTQVSVSFKGSDSGALKAFQDILSLGLLKKENPDIFWLDYASQSCSVMGGTQRLEATIKYRPAYMKGNELDIQKIKQTQTQLDKLVETVGTGKTTLDSVRQFNTWITSNVKYSGRFDMGRGYEITGALLDKSAVCQGYAESFKYLCDRAGISCVVVSGKGILSGTVYDHEWNYVRLDDGKWYMVDCTWNALSADKEKWFLCGSGASVGGLTVSNSHKAMAGRKYPTLSTTSYAS